jgi:hypothetical protein
MMTGGVRIEGSMCAYVYISLFSLNKQSKKKTLKEGERERESLANRHDESNNASAIRTVTNPRQQG